MQIVGYSDRGFSIDGTNKLELEFTIPRQTTATNFPDVELWIIPDKSGVEPNSKMIIKFLARADISEASNPRTDQGEATWNTRDDCVVLNLTILSKKIYKVLQKRSLNESNVSLVIEITRTEMKPINDRNDSMNSRPHDFCSALSQRRTNDSFLVIKNYDEKGDNVMINWRKKRDTASIDAIHSSKLITTSQTNCCNRTSLVVNLTEVYGAFMKGPAEIDIGECTGECAMTSNSNLFSYHAIVIERLKRLPKGKALSEFVPRCTPVAFKPLHVLFGVQDNSNVIVQLPDMVVGKCACR